MPVFDLCGNVENLPENDLGGQMGGQMGGQNGLKKCVKSYR
jgi:hypothetical protein